MHPIVFSLDGLRIHSYGLMLGLSFVIAWQLGLRNATREGYPGKVVAAAYLLAIVFALVGARLAHVLANWSDYRLHGESLVSVRFEGLTAYGGFIGAPLAVWVYLRLKKRDPWSFFDGSTAGLVLGLGLTRIGCFLAGCCHGRPTSLPWGVVFPPGSRAAGTFPGADGSVPVHPSQLYEALFGFALFPVAIVLYRRRTFTGQAFLVITALYAVGRFLLELVRGDTDRGYVAGPLSTSQCIGLALVPFALTLYLLRRKSGSRPPDQSVRSGS